MHNEGNMPIKQLKNNSITQRCAKCGEDRDVTYLEIELGVEIDSEAGFKDTNVIALPPCEKCGAKEFLLRNWDKSNEPETSTRLLHRRAVNSLAKSLKKKGRINAACEKEIEEEKEEPPDTLEMDVGENGLDVYIDHVRPS